MDTLSHALWGRGLFGYRGSPYWSLFFGIVPDLFSFGIYFLINIFDKSNSEIRVSAETELPNYVYSLYDVTHSLVIALIIVLVVYFFINKKLAFAMLAWPFHIALDFPFHTADFFPTPILWPLYDVQFDGVPWSSPLVWFSNIGGIVILYLYRFIKKS